MLLFPFFHRTFRAAYSAGRLIFCSHRVDILTAQIYLNCTNNLFKLHKFLITGELRIFVEFTFKKPRRETHLISEGNDTPLPDAILAGLWHVFFVKNFTLLRRQRRTVPPILQTWVPVFVREREIKRGADLSLGENTPKICSLWSRSDYVPIRQILYQFIRF